MITKSKKTVLLGLLVAACAVSGTTQGAFFSCFGDGFFSPISKRIQNCFAGRSEVAGNQLDAVSAGRCEVDTLMNEYLKLHLQHDIADLKRQSKGKTYYEACNNAYFDVTSSIIKFINSIPDSTLVCLCAAICICSIAAAEYFDNKRAQMQEERALKIYHILNGELCEIKKVIQGKVPFEYSTLRNYLGTVDVMRLPHFEQLGLYLAVQHSALRRETKLEKQVLECLHTIRQVAVALATDATCYHLRQQLYLQVKAIFSRINKRLLWRDTKFNEQIRSILVLDDEMTEFLTA